MIRPVRSVVLLPLPAMLGACASVPPGMPPRVLTKLGEPASIRVGTDEHAIEVQVTTRREGADVRVDAVLTETGVAEPRMATAVARCRPASVGRSPRASAATASCSARRRTA